MEQGPKIVDVNIFGVHARWERFHICAGKQQVFCLRIDLAKLLTHTPAVQHWSDRYKDPGT